MALFELVSMETVPGGPIATRVLAERRRAEIAAFRMANPCLTLAGIGQRFGVTKERVRQVLARGGATTVALRPPPLMVPLICDNCGIHFERRESIVLKGARSPLYIGKWVACSTSCSLMLLAQRRAPNRKGNLGYRKPICKRGHPRTPENLRGCHARSDYSGDQTGGNQKSCIYA